jgi:hypothetical protein
MGWLFFMACDIAAIFEYFWGVIAAQRAEGDVSVGVTFGGAF